MQAVFGKQLHKVHSDWSFYMPVINSTSIKLSFPERTIDLMLSRNGQYRKYAFYTGINTVFSYYVNITYPFGYFLYRLLGNFNFVWPDISQLWKDNFFAKRKLY